MAGLPCSSCACLAFLLILLSSFLPTTYAAPVRGDYLHLLVSRNDGAIINVSPDGGVTVFNPDTQSIVTQGPATDGAGSGFDLPAVIWLVFAFVLGPPLAIAGIRGARVTTGISLGLAAAVCVWAAIVNTIGANGLSDTIIDVIVLVFFLAGTAVGGLLPFTRIAAIVALGISGGFAFGVRIVLLREGLLLSNFIFDWLIVAFLGVGGIVLTVMKQRAAITLSSASVGTFLIGLGADLLLHKQAGMSRGLRFLFDRNSSHLADIFENGYHPTLFTQIILGVSLGVVPVFAYAQHKVFPQPFWHPMVEDENDLESLRASQAMGNDFQPPMHSVAPSLPGAWDPPAMGPRYPAEKLTKANRSYFDE